jgi:hypothetical protein
MAKKRTVSRVRGTKISGFRVRWSKTNFDNSSMAKNGLLPYIPLKGENIAVMVDPVKGTLQSGAQPLYQWRIQLQSREKRMGINTLINGMGGSSTDGAHELVNGIKRDIDLWIMAMAGARHAAWSTKMQGIEVYLWLLHLLLTSELQHTQSLLREVVESKQSFLSFLI